MRRQVAFFSCGQRSLKVKIKTLAAESRIIKQEIRKCKPGGVLQGTLNHHRITVVRNEARSALLAYQFLRHKPCPESGHDPTDREVKPIIERAESIARKFGYYQRDSDLFIKWYTSTREACGRQPAFNPASTGSTPVRVE